MRSSLLFIALTLSAQLSACRVASSGGIPPLDLDTTNTVGTMLLLAGQSNKGYQYSATDGSYKVTFPGKPTEQNKTLQTKLGPINALFVIYAANQGRRAFLASSTQYQIDPRHYDVEKGLDGARDGVAKSTNATISHETKIHYKGTSGRQFYLTMKQGKGKVRIYIVNAGKQPTIYQTVVIDTAGKVDDAEANAFLDSLTFKPR